MLKLRTATAFGMSMEASWYVDICVEDSLTNWSASTHPTPVVYRIADPKVGGCMINVPTCR